MAKTLSTTKNIVLEIIASKLYTYQLNNILTINSQ